MPMHKGSATKANPSRGGDAKPRDPRGQPGCRTERLLGPHPRQGCNRASRDHRGLPAHPCRDSSAAGPARRARLGSILAPARARRQRCRGRYVGRPPGRRGPAGRSAPGRHNGVSQLRRGEPPLGLCEPHRTPEAAGLPGIWARGRNVRPAKGGGAYLSEPDAFRQAGLARTGWCWRTTGWFPRRYVLSCAPATPAPPRLARSTTCPRRSHCQSQESR
jgi:hypothetical protein